MKLLTRKRFGLPAEPWIGWYLDTADAIRAGEAARAAVEARAFVSILGPRGGGKTRAVRAALNGAGAKVVAPMRLTRERLHMGDIETALVRELSDERPRRSGEARSHQVGLILGKASMAAPVVLFIDDAHVLHHATLRALKRLRELVWWQEAGLLGIVLAGQVDKVAAIPEVGLRADTVWLAGLTPQEAAKALGLALNRRRKLIALEAAAALAASSRARNWLDLQALADECLAEALARGQDTITREVADSVLGLIAEPKQAASDDDVEALLMRRAS